MYLAHSNGYDMMSGNSWAWGLLMMLFGTVLIVAIVFLIARAGSPNSNNKSPRDESLTIARNRYARGEITRKEFEQLKKDLVL